MSNETPASASHYPAAPVKEKIDFYRRNQFLKT